VKIENLKELVVEIRDEKVLLDADIAVIYGVKTRDINKAVTNNPEKFPAGYIIELSKPEKNELVENLHRFNKLKHSTVNPKAFSERGLYMLATILKGEVATQTTLAIVDTFYKIKHLSRNVKELAMVSSKAEQKSLMQKSGELIAEILDDDLAVTDSETSIELNFAVLKFKHTVKKKKS